MRFGKLGSAMLYAPGRFVAVACLAMLAMARLAVPAVADEAALWTALKEGRAFAMMRHALAPGYSDPDGFKLGDCRTQRNLSDQGRAQARATGARFRQAGIASAQVLTSQWCRCRETAALLGIGPVRDLPPLNSFFEHDERRQPQTDALKAWLAANPPRNGAPLVLVTHQVNISALTGVGTGSGEIVVVRMRDNGRVEVMGRL